MKLALWKSKINVLLVDYYQSWWSNLSENLLKVPLMLLFYDSLCNETYHQHIKVESQTAGKKWGYFVSHS